MQLLRLLRDLVVVKDVGPLATRVRKLPTMALSLSIAV